MTSITFNTKTTKAALNGEMITEKPVAQFRTRYQAEDRVSASVKIVAMHFDEKLRQIRVIGSDTKIRKCNVDRLPSVEVGRELWKMLAKAGKEQKEVQFVAAGGFSPDVWFYTVK
jgi:hypothetical protein